MQRAVDPPVTRLVADWTNRMSAIARNLIDFNESESAQRLKARLASVTRPYTGQTAARAREAADALDGLWRDYLLVSRVVDEAAVLARKSGLLSNTDEAVRALLEGASIEMPAISVPVNRRGLLDGAERITRARPDEVLDSMLNAFAKARDMVTAIAEAEATTMRRVQALADETTALRDWSLATGEDIGLPDTGVAALQDADGDPLAARDHIVTAEAALARARVKKQEIETRIARFKTGLDRAASRLVALRDARADAIAAIKDHTAAFGGVPASVTEDPAPALEAWLATLRAIAGDRWKAAAIGLARWDEVCQSHMDDATRIRATARAPLDAMENVKGRFRALRVKAARVAAGWRDEPRRLDLQILDARASESLKRRPFDLDEAKRTVDAFEEALAVQYIAPTMESRQP